MLDGVELQAVTPRTTSYSNLSSVSRSSITPRPGPPIESDDEEDLRPELAAPQAPPEAARDCPPWCMAVTKATLVGGFVGGAMGGSAFGLLGAIAGGLGGAYFGALLGTCLEFICPPLAATPANYAPTPDIEHGQPDIEAAVVA